MDYDTAYSYNLQFQNEINMIILDPFDGQVLDALRQQNNILNKWNYLVWASLYTCELLATCVNFLRFTFFFFSQHIFCEYVILKLETVEQKMTVYIEHSIVNYSTVSYKLQLTGQPSHIVFFLLPVMTQVSTFMYGKQALQGFSNCQLKFSSSANIFVSAVTVKSKQKRGMNVAKTCQIHCNGIYKIHLNVYMCMNATHSNLLPSLSL